MGTSRVTVPDLENGWCCTDCAQIWYTARDRLAGCRTRVSWRYPIAISHVQGPLPRSLRWSSQQHLLVITICKNIIVNCYTFTEIHKYTDTRRPAWPDRDGATLHYMPNMYAVPAPGRSVGYQTIRQPRRPGQPTGLAKRPSGKTSLINNQDRSLFIISVHKTEVASYPHNLANFHSKHQIIISLIACLFFRCIILPLLFGSYFSVQLAGQA